MAIKEFFENDDLTVLTATCANNRIIFLHEVPQEAEFSLIFYKIPKSNYQLHQTTTNNENHSALDTQIGLLTLEGGMVKSIYNSLTRVFSAKSSKVISFVCSFFFVDESDFKSSWRVKRCIV